jgi:uncharacterized protein (DUF302 family)
MPRILAATLLLLLAVTPAGAEPLPGTVTQEVAIPFAELDRKMEDAVSSNGLSVVARLSPSETAAGRGIRIPGNIMLMVFNNPFALRVLSASLAAGYEAPLRIYLAEKEDGKGTVVTYRLPSVLFRPYGSAELDAIGVELDGIMRRIVTTAIRN